MWAAPQNNYGIIHPEMQTANNTMDREETFDQDLLDHENGIDPEDIQKIALTLSSREVVEPSTEVWESIQKVIHARPTALQREQRSWRKWVFLVTVWIAATLLLWGGLNPGIVIQIDPVEDAQGIYRVYRSTNGGNYQLLREYVPDGSDRFEYTDILILPTREYQYQIDFYSASGELIGQQFHEIDGAEALPAQIALLFAGLLITFAVYQLVKDHKWFQFSNRVYINSFAEPENP
jgi:hypothetical protein